MQTTTTSISAADIVNIVSTILSFLTLVIVFFTLLEMKAQRYKQYKPSIIFERQTFLLKTENYVPSSENRWQSSATHISTFDSMYFKVKNIGEYPARDLRISILKSNIQLIKRAFNTIDYSALIEDENGIYKIQKSENTTVYIQPELVYHLPYLLGNAGNDDKLWLPTIYTILLQRAILRTNYNHDIKRFKVVVDISYSDICGKRYNEKINLYFDMKYMTVDQDENGEVEFEISMVKKQ